jgi:gas vesicle protein
MKGFAMGAALGAIAGILFAPRGGKETQKMLKDKAHEVKGMVAAKAAELKKISEESYAQLVEEAVFVAKQKKMSAKEIDALKKDLLARYKDLKKKFGTKKTTAKKIPAKKK